MAEPERQPRSPLSVSVLFSRRRRKGVHSSSPSWSVLPVELVEDIFSCLISSAATSELVLAQKDLGAAARVCRTWYAAAMPLLYRKVQLDIEACVYFCTTLNRKPSLRALTQSIHFFGSTETYHVFSMNEFVPLRRPKCALGASDDGMYDLFEQILDLCPNVREVHLPLPLGANFPETLCPPFSAVSAKLRKLEVSASGDDAHLDDGDLAFSDAVLSALKHPILANLNELTLTAFTLRARAPVERRSTDQLRHKQLPPLRSLRLRSNLPLATQSEAAIRELIDAFRPSLRSVEIAMSREVSVAQTLAPVFSSLTSLTFYPASLHVNRFDRFSRLAHLSLSLSPTETLTHRHLPHSLQHLTIRFDYRPWQVARSAYSSITHVAGALPNLGTIALRAPSRERDVGTWRILAFICSQTALTRGVTVQTSVQVGESSACF